MYLHRYEYVDFLILTLYVDDIIVAGSYMKKIDDLKKLAKKFFMKDLGETKQHLGIQISRDRKNKKL